MRQFALTLPLLLLGCPKEPSPYADAGTTPTVTTSSVPAVAPQTNLAPLDDTSTAAPSTGAVKPKATGAGGGTAAAGSSNAARIKQCCDGLRKQAATLAPASQEAQTAAQAAALCDGIAAAVASPAAVGQAPEFAPVRQMMQGKAIPSVCQGL